MIDNREKANPPKSADELLLRYNNGERQFKEAELDEAFLEQAVLREAILIRANLWRANLASADLTGADLRKAVLRAANLKGANLRGADLRGAYLWTADLEGAALDGAKLWGANIEKANLARADLTGTELDGANLTKADLSEAILWFARLPGANLEEANLTDALLHHAYFGSVNLASSSVFWHEEPAKGLTQEQIDSAKGNEHTILPHGFDQPGSWIASEKPKLTGISGGEPKLIIGLKGESEPKTLQSLSRESAAFSDHLTNLAYFMKCKPILPIVDISKEALVLGITDELLAGLSALVAAAQPLVRYSNEAPIAGIKGHQRGEAKRIQTEIDRLLKDESAFAEVAGDKDAKRIMKAILTFLVEFHRRGGELRLYAPPQEIKQESPKRGDGTLRMYVRNSSKREGETLD